MDHVAPQRWVSQRITHSSQFLLVNGCFFNARQFVVFASFTPAPELAPLEYVAAFPSLFHAYRAMRRLRRSHPRLIDAGFLEDLKEAAHARMTVEHQ